jgi:hypothetical protein
MHAQTKTHDPRSIRSLTPSPRRLSDRLADPASLTSLQERLAHHSADLSGQLPELLLRVPDPQEAVGSWLADKDLSHWIPQAERGGAQLRDGSSRRRAGIAGRWTPGARHRSRIWFFA